MNAKRLIVSLLVGFAFGFLTWLIFGGHLPYPRHIGRGLEYLGWVITIVSLPGLFAAMVASGNVHGGNIVLAVLGNFLFYFGATYFTLSIWEKRKAKSLGLPQTPQDGVS
jgi:hypothetical protein